MNPTVTPVYSTTDYLLEHSPAVTYTRRPDLDFGATSITSNVKDQLGYKPEEFLADSSFWLDHIHPDDKERVLNDLVALFVNDSHVHEYRFLAADGDYRWMRDQLLLIRDPDGKPKEIVGYWIDITERTQTEQELLRHKTALSVILGNLIDAVITIDEGGIVESFNPAAEQLFGYSAGEIIGKNIKELMPSPYREQHDSYLENYLTSGKGKILGVGPREVVAQRKDGSIIPIDMAISEANIDGRRVFIGVVRDITERKDAQDRLIRMANYDLLTGLPNRMLLIERMNHAIDQAERNQQLVALLHLNLNRFNLINESLGHEAGDELLRIVAKRLTESVRKSDTVARLGSEKLASIVARIGSDDFALVLEGIQHINEVVAIAQRISNAFKRPFVGESREFFTGASIGIAICPLDDKTVDELLRDATTAMFQAKVQGGNGFTFYSAQMGKQVQLRLELDNELRRALKEEQFVLHYQPQVELQTGRLVGSEALLRWQSPDKGLVSPFEFIPVLEDTGLIVAVGEWVLWEACRQNRAWQEAGFSDLGISINLSCKQFNDPELSNKIRGILEKTGLDPKFLDLEITESTVMEEPKAAEDTLYALHAIGIQLSIDDFGTGYSSLANLKRLPLHTLKLDRSFVKDIPNDSDNVAITKAVLTMSDSLNLKVIAEGVETQEQLKFLISHGCALMQGYYFSRPLPPDALLQLLQEGRHLTVAERRADRQRSNEA